MLDQVLGNQCLTCTSLEILKNWSSVEQLFHELKPSDVLLSHCTDNMLKFWVFELNIFTLENSWNFSLFQWYKPVIIDIFCQHVEQRFICLWSIWTLPSGQSVVTLNWSGTLVLLCSALLLFFSPCLTHWCPFSRKMKRCLKLRLTGCQRVASLMCLSC